GSSPSAEPPAVASGTGPAVRTIAWRPPSVAMPSVHHTASPTRRGAPSCVPPVARSSAVRGEGQEPYGSVVTMGPAYALQRRGSGGTTGPGRAGRAAHLTAAAPSQVIAGFSRHGPVSGAPRAKASSVPTAEPRPRACGPRETLLAESREVWSARGRPRSPVIDAVKGPVWFSSSPPRVPVWGSAPTPRGLGARA